MQGNQDKQEPPSHSPLIPVDDPDRLDIPIGVILPYIYVYLFPLRGLGPRPYLSPFLHPLPNRRISNIEYVDPWP